MGKGDKNEKRKSNRIIYFGKTNQRKIGNLIAAQK